MSQKDQAMSTIRKRWDTWLVLTFSAILLILPMFLNMRKVDAADGLDDVRLKTSLAQLTEFSWTGVNLQGEEALTNATTQDAYQIMRAKRWAEDIGLSPDGVQGAMIRQIIPLREAGQKGKLTASMLYSGTRLVSAWIDTADGQQTSLRDASMRLPEGVTLGDLRADELSAVEIYGPAMADPPYGAIERIADRTQQLQLQKWLRSAQRTDARPDPDALGVRMIARYRDGAALEIIAWEAIGETLLSIPALGAGFVSVESGVYALVASDAGWEEASAQLLAARKLIEAQGLVVKESAYEMGSYTVRGETERAQLQRMSSTLAIAAQIQTTSYTQLRWKLQTLFIEGQSSDEVTACFLFVGDKVQCAWLEAPWAGTPQSVNKTDRVALNDRSWLD